jgi:hypothetical protein
MTAATLICCVLFAQCWRKVLRAASVDPMVSATLNGSSDAVLYVGQPAVFELEIAHPDLWEGTLEPIQIELANGVSWTNAVKCRVFSSAGDAVTWPLWMRPATNHTIALDQNVVARLCYLISPQDTLALAPGNYSVQFVLDTQSNAAAGGWAGTADSIRMDVGVQEEPANLSEVQLARRATLLAEYYALREDYPAGLTALDLLLVTQPRSIEALRLKAELLELAGNSHAALALLDDAVGVFMQDNPHPQEAPLQLLNQRSVVQGLVRQAGVRIITATAINGDLRIGWDGQEGVTYRVESSSDFRSWQTETNGLTVVSGIVNWTTSLGPGAQFYRVVLE